MPQATAPFDPPPLLRAAFQILHKSVHATAHTPAYISALVLPIDVIITHSHPHPQQIPLAGFHHPQPVNTTQPRGKT